MSSMPTYSSGYYVKALAFAAEFSQQKDSRKVVEQIEFN